MNRPYTAHSPYSLSPTERIPSRGVDGGETVDLDRYDENDSLDDYDDYDEDIEEYYEPIDRRWVWVAGVAGATALQSRPLAFGEEHERKGSSVEVKIGITDSPRELIFNSAQTPSEVEKLITDALSEDSAVVTLTDEKGRRFLVQSAKIAYVEIGAADVRRVGFGVGAVGSEAVKTG